MYAQRHYTLREAAIIATGFSTVSAPFMVIVAKTLNLMPAWNLYFWGCMAITFAVTAVSARIYPISRLPSEGSADPALPEGRSRVQAAGDAGIDPRPARMTGSGACVFLPLDSEIDAVTVRNRLQGRTDARILTVRSLARHPLREWAFDGVAASHGVD